MVYAFSSPLPDVCLSVHAHAHERVGCSVKWPLEANFPWGPEPAMADIDSSMVHTDSREDT